VARSGEFVAGPLECDVLSVGAEGVIDAVRAERREVRIDVEVVQLGCHREDRLAHIVVEHSVHPAELKEPFPDFDEIATMGEGRVLLSSQLLNGLHDAADDGRERVVHERFKGEFDHFVVVVAL